MNTIANEMVTYFNFFDFFTFSVDFEFKELENEIYTFLDQNNIKFPKKAFLNKGDLFQFYDTFTLDTQPNFISVLTISADVFSITLPLSYPYLKLISVASNNCAFQSIDRILYSKNLDTILCFPVKHKFLSYRIPVIATSIGNSVFSHCSNLQSITIPTSVTSIGNSVFSRCYNLRSVSIPHTFKVRIIEIFPQNQLYEIGGCDTTKGFWDTMSYLKRNFILFSFKSS